MFGCGTKPKNLKTQGLAADQPQGLSTEALDVATARTQLHRVRATHLLQVSEQAAQWIARTLSFNSAYPTTTTLFP